MSDTTGASGSATPAKPTKKRTSSTRRKSGSGGKSKAASAASGKPKPVLVVPGESVAVADVETPEAVPEGVETPETVAEISAAIQDRPEAAVEASAVVAEDTEAGEQLGEGATAGIPAPSEEPQVTPLVTQWLSRPLSPTAEERLERMRRTVPGYQRPSRPAMTALYVLSWALFLLLGIAVGATLLGALDRTMESSLVGGQPAGPASQLIPAKEGQRVRVVNDAGVNLRSQPRQGVTFVMVRLKKGTILTLVASKPGEPTAWFKVKAPTGENGWVVDDKTYTQLIEAPR